jgi:long-chain acyl-CoA synthetase
LAIVSQSLWSVSLYETLGPEASEYILNHGSLASVVTSITHIPTLLKLSARLPNLKLIISTDSLDAGEPAGLSKAALLRASAAESGIQIYSMTEVEELGARSGRGMRPPTPDDIATINYTSGTTGNPKGVILTHKVANAGICAARSNRIITEGDTGISYLPCAHIYGRMVDQAVLAVGGRIGYFHGDILNLVEDMKLLKPDGFMSVPRLYNRFASALQDATVGSDGIKGALARRVIDAKMASMSLPIGKAHNTHAIYDRIWTPKVRQALGLDKARALISGSAQLDPSVQQFLRAALGNHFMQGFGMTETYAVGISQFRGDFSTGYIGSPSCGMEVCIESVPDMEYTVDDKPNPRGEMLLRGPCVFSEYYKNPEETKKSVESDGWFHSGDIVEVDSMGRFKIIDRKKNVLKLSQGEYISPERIENVYMANTNLINVAFVHGDPTQSSLVGIFGIDPVHFAPFAGKVLQKSIGAEDLTALKAAANDPRVKKAFLQKLDAIAKKQKFSGFEKVKNCHLDIEPFTMQNELLTPT